MGASPSLLTHFNPRSSCEERQACGRLPAEKRHISIHAPHARSDEGFGITFGNRVISIHAPHARSDKKRNRVDDRGVTISIHAPHARSDDSGSMPNYNFEVFQSTLLMRGATRSYSPSRHNNRHFNPRSSCEERHQAPRLEILVAVFQSTLLMRGATSYPLSRLTNSTDFNPRSSCEERPRRSLRSMPSR